MFLSVSKIAFTLSSLSLARTITSGDFSFRANCSSLDSASIEHASDEFLSCFGASRLGGRDRQGQPPYDLRIRRCEIPHRQTWRAGRIVISDDAARAGSPFSMMAPSPPATMEDSHLPASSSQTAIRDSTRYGLPSIMYKNERRGGSGNAASPTSNR
jgi:hypothetical protein